MQLDIIEKESKTYMLQSPGTWQTRYDGVNLDKNGTHWSHVERWTARLNPLSALRIFVAHEKNGSKAKETYYLAPPVAFPAEDRPPFALEIRTIPLNRKYTKWLRLIYIWKEPGKRKEIFREIYSEQNSDFKKYFEIERDNKSPQKNRSQETRRQNKKRPKWTGGSPPVIRSQNRNSQNTGSQWTGGSPPMIRSQNRNSQNTGSQRTGGKPPTTQTQNNRSPQKIGTQRNVDQQERQALNQKRFSYDFSLYSKWPIAARTHNGKKYLLYANDENSNKSDESETKISKETNNLTITISNSLRMASIYELFYKDTEDSMRSSDVCRRNGMYEKERSGLQGFESKLMVHLPVGEKERRYYFQLPVDQTDLWFEVEIIVQEYTFPSVEIEYSFWSLDIGTSKSSVNWIQRYLQQQVQYQNHSQKIDFSSTLTHSARENYTGKCGVTPSISQNIASEYYHRELKIDRSASSTSKEYEPSIKARQNKREFEEWMPILMEAITIYAEANFRSKDRKIFSLPSQLSFSYPPEFTNGEHIKPPIKSKRQHMRKWAQRIVQRTGNNPIHVRPGINIERSEKMIREVNPNTAISLHLTEPVAAFNGIWEQINNEENPESSHLIRRQIQYYSKIIIIDIGAGTTDFAIFYRNKNEIQWNFLLQETDRGTSGNAFDQLFEERIKNLKAGITLKQKSTETWVELFDEIMSQQGVNINLWEEIKEKLHIECKKEKNIENIRPEMRAVAEFIKRNSPDYRPEYRIEYDDITDEIVGRLTKQINKKLENIFGNILDEEKKNVLVMLAGRGSLLRDLDKKLSDKLGLSVLRASFKPKALKMFVANGVSQNILQSIATYTRHLTPTVMCMIHGYKPGERMVSVRERIFVSADVPTEKIKLENGSIRHFVFRWPNGSTSTIRTNIKGSESYKIELKICLKRLFNDGWQGPYGEDRICITCNEFSETLIWKGTSNLDV